MALLEIVGESFRPDLTAWFGDIEAATVYRSETSLVCTIPDASLYKTSMFASFSHDYSSSSAGSSKPVMTMMMSQPLQVPLNLVRNDGIIYNTGFNFTYTPEPILPSNMSSSTNLAQSNSSSSSAASSSSSSNQLNVSTSSSSMY